MIHVDDPTARYWAKGEGICSQISTMLLGLGIVVMHLLPRRLSSEPKDRWLLNFSFKKEYRQQYHKHFARSTAIILFSKLDYSCLTWQNNQKLLTRWKCGVKQWGTKMKHLIIQSKVSWKNEVDPLCTVVSNDGCCEWNIKLPRWVRRLVIWTTA